MQVYLMRHGKYISKDLDPTGALSLNGRNEVTKLVQSLSARHLHLDYLWHSNILRAKQTAYLVAEHLSYTGECSEHSDINHSGDPSLIAAQLNQADGNILLVSHMPFLPKLLSKLILDDEQHDLVTFQMSTIVCIEKIGLQQWIINWVLHPELIHGE